MATYTRHYSTFPESVYTPHNFKDADDVIAPYINTIKNYMAQGNYSQAQFYMEQNKDMLEPYMLTTEHINQIEEETRNTELYAWGRKQAVFYSDDEPPYVEINDVWIGGGDGEPWPDPEPEPEPPVVDTYYTVKWDNYLATYGSYINDVNISSSATTTTQNGWKQIRYNDGTGYKVANPYQTGSITVKNGTNIEFIAYSIASTSQYPSVIRLREYTGWNGVLTYYDDPYNAWDPESFEESYNHHQGSETGYGGSLVTNYFSVDSLHWTSDKEATLFLDGSDDRLSDNDRDFIWKIGIAIKA